MMQRGSAALLVAGILVLAAPAFGQEARKGTAESDKIDPDRPRTTVAGEGAKGGGPENPTFDDLRNSLGELEQKESKEEKDKRDAIVQKNVDDTLKIYGDALGKRNGDLQNVNHRLDVNQGLEGKYDKLLKAARVKLAVTRSQYINRTVALKKSLDDGKISKDAYDKLLDDDTKRYKNREKELQDDIAFYQEEHSNAQRSVKDLATKKELMAFDPFGGEQAAEAEQAPKIGIAQKLKATLADVSGYKMRSVVDTLK
jgi:hypothetical protein